MWNSRIPPEIPGYCLLVSAYNFNCSILQILQKLFLTYIFFSQDLVFKIKQNISFSNQGEPRHAIIRWPLKGYAGLLEWSTTQIPPPEPSKRYHVFFFLLTWTFELLKFISPHSSQDPSSPEMACTSESGRSQKQESGTLHTWILKCN